MIPKNTIKKLKYHNTSNKFLYSYYDIEQDLEYLDKVYHTKMKHAFIGIDPFDRDEFEGVLNVDVFEEPSEMMKRIIEHELSYIELYELMVMGTL